MAQSLIANGQYRIGNVEYQFGYASGTTKPIGEMRIHDSIFVLDSNHLEPITDISVIRYGSDYIELVDINGNTQYSFIRKTFEEMNIEAKYFLSFVLDEIVGDLPQRIEFIADMEEELVQGSHVYPPLIKDTTLISGNQTMNVELNGADKSSPTGAIESIVAHDIQLPMTFNFEVIDPSQVTTYKNTIKVYLCIGIHFVDNTLFEEWDYAPIDITDLCSISETQIVSNHQFLTNYVDVIEIKNHELSEELTIVLGGDDGIQRFDGYQEHMFEHIGFGSNLMVTLTLYGGYYFTQDSIQPIKDLIENTIIGDIGELPCETITYELNEDGEIEITFVKVFRNYPLDSEIMRIYEDSSGEHPNVSEVFARSNPKLVATNLVGVTIDEVVGTHYPFNSDPEFIITTLDGYFEEDKTIRVLQDGVDITSQCVITDSNIHILNIRGDITINITAKKIWELRLTYENQLLHTFSDIPSIISVLFKQGSTANKYILTINGEDTELTISHLTTTLIVGIGQTRLIIPINAPFTKFNLEPYGSDGVTTFEIIDRKRPIPTDFSLNLYKMNGEKNVVDKTSVLQSIGSLNGTLRESCSITNPIVTIEYSGVPNFNYVYIPNFNRYYFVTEITNVRNDLWSISLKVDVLMSFKDEIVSQRCVVARNEFEFNDLLKDEQRLVQDDDEYEVIDISRSDNPLKSDGYESTGQYVIQVIRG